MKVSNLYKYLSKSYKNFFLLKRRQEQEAHHGGAGDEIGADDRWRWRRGGDVAWRTAKSRQVSLKMELGGRVSRGESLTSVARAFHRTPHVHRRWTRAPKCPPLAGSTKTEHCGVLCRSGGYICRQVICTGSWHEPVKEFFSWLFLQLFFSWFFL